MSTKYLVPWSVAVLLVLVIAAIVWQTTPNVDASSSANSALAQQPSTGGRQQGGQLLPASQPNTVIDRSFHAPQTSTYHLPKQISGEKEVRLIGRPR